MWLAYSQPRSETQEYQCGEPAMKIRKRPASRGIFSSNNIANWSNLIDRCTVEGSIVKRYFSLRRTRCTGGRPEGIAG